MEGLKRFKAFGIIGALVLIFLGILMLGKPVMIEVLFDWIIGVVLLACGIFQIMNTISVRNSVNHVWRRLLPGIVMIILGVFVVVHEGASIFMIGIMIAVFAFSLAFDRFSVGNIRRKEGKKWVSTMLFGLVHFIFAVFMLYNAFVMITAMIMIGGIYLIVAGIMIAISIFKFKDL